MHFDYANMALAEPADSVRGFNSGVDRLLIREKDKRGALLIRAIPLLFIALTAAFLYFYTTLSLIEIAAMAVSWLLFTLMGVLICGLFGYLLWELTDLAISKGLEKYKS
jgi:hypothetical protein